MAKPGDPFFRVTAVHLDGSYRCTQISDVDFVKSAHMKAYSPSTGEWDTDT